MHVVVKRPAGERYPTPKLTGLTACLNYRAFAYALCYLFCGPEDQMIVTSLVARKTKWPLLPMTGDL